MFFMYLYVNIVKLKNVSKKKLCKLRILNKEPVVKWDKTCLILNYTPISIKDW